MSVKSISQHLKGLALFAILVGLIAYFSYQAVHGDHGLRRRIELKQQIAELDAELATLKAAQSRLERDISLMGGDGIVARDMLDEQARALLNVVHPDEIVIISQPPQGK